MHVNSESLLSLRTMSVLSIPTYDGKTVPIKSDGHNRTVGFVVSLSVSQRPVLMKLSNVLVTSSLVKNMLELVTFFLYILFDPTYFGALCQTVAVH